MDHIEQLKKQAQQLYPNDPQLSRAHYLGALEQAYHQAQQKHTIKTLRRYIKTIKQYGPNSPQAQRIKHQNRNNPDFTQHTTLDTTKTTLADQNPTTKTQTAQQRGLINQTGNRPGGTVTGNYKTPKQP